MSRQRLNSDQLLNRIFNETGSKRMAMAADRLLGFGDSLQAVRIGRQASISVRIPSAENDREWLTLFFVRTSGNLTTYYQYLWERHGVAPSVASKYERRLVKLFGKDVIGSGIPATDVIKKWAEFSSIVRESAEKISDAVRGLDPAGGNMRTSKAVAALEGIVSEARVYRRSRSRTLRNQAIGIAKGRCAGCDTAFGELLGGRGSRVLQVHHKQQLSLQARPKLTKVTDLAVVCANCHVLIHADPDAALRVDAIRALWEKYRSQK